MKTRVIAVALCLALLLALGPLGLDIALRSSVPALANDPVGGGGGGG